MRHVFVLCCISTRFTWRLEIYVISVLSMNLFGIRGKMAWSSIAEQAEQAESADDYEDFLGSEKAWFPPPSLEIPVSLLSAPKFRCSFSFLLDSQVSFPSMLIPRQIGTNLPIINCRDDFPNNLVGSAAFLGAVQWFSKLWGYSHSQRFRDLHHYWS